MEWSLLAVVLCVNFAACSDDDENEPSVTPTLAGTTWSVLTTNEEDLEPGATVTFKTDGTVTWDIPESEWMDSKILYHLNGNELKIVYNDDDYQLGTIFINGKTATYRYKWYDIDGTWQDEEYSYVTLQKQ